MWNETNLLVDLFGSKFNGKGTNNSGCKEYK